LIAKNQKVNGSWKITRKTSSESHGYVVGVLAAKGWQWCIFNGIQPGLNYHNRAKEPVIADELRPVRNMGMELGFETGDT